MINRFYISVLAITFALSATCGASALEISNGLSVNGLSVNGLSVNGLSVNGLSVNGLSVNGLSVNGLSVNGRDATGAFPVGMKLQAAILQDGTLISLGQ